MPSKCDLEVVASKGKRPMDSESKEEDGSRKTLKLFGVMLEVHNVPTNQPGDQQEDGVDQSGTNTLINHIGRDLSITCLLRCSRANYGVVASLNRSFWSLIKSGDMYKLRRANGIVEHWVYVSCQLGDWKAFDLMARRWMNLPAMNASQSFTCSDKESLGVGTQVLVFGRETFGLVIYKYNILTNSWSLGESMHFPRSLFGCASLGHICILAGGCDFLGKLLNVVEIYDSEKESWEVLPPMNKARKSCSGVFLDEKFYVIGGIGIDSKILTCGEEFNLKTRTWRVIANMSPVGTDASTCGSPPLVAVVKNQLYAVDYALMVLKKLSKVTWTWSTIGTLPEYSGSINGWGLAFKGCGDRLIIIGGPKNGDERGIEVNSWVPNEDPPQWVLLSRKCMNSFVYNCAVMGC